MAEKNTRTGLSLDDMTTLIKAVSESGLESFDYKEGDFSITLHSNRTTGIYQAAPASAPVALSMPDISMAMATAAEAASGAEDEEDWEDDDDPNSIYMYDFSNAAMKALTLAGIDTVDPLKAMTDEQLSAIPGLSAKDVKRIRKVLSYEDEDE